MEHYLEWENGYKPTHPWYYVLGGAIPTPRQIKSYGLVTGLPDFMLENVIAANNKPEPQRSAELQLLRQKALKRLRQHLSRYRQVASALRAHRLTENGDPAFDEKHSDIAFKFTHTCIAFAVLQTIDKLPTQRLRGKGFFMTFDLERYRAHIAPLNLDKEQEDELLRDLWGMTEALVDQCFTSPTYPLQLAITKQAFDAIEEALALVSKETEKEEEVKKGDGLASQERRCRDFAAYKGYDVAAIFQDDGISGGLVDRPGMKSMLAWIRKHRKEEPVVLIDDISRFARGVEAHLKLRAAIALAGANLKSPSIEFGDDADSRTFELVAAVFAQHQREKNAEQVVHRMKARLLNGYFPFWVPTGYKYADREGQSGRVLVRDEPNASLIEEALKGFATGRFQTQAEVKRFLEPHSIFARDAKGEIHPQRIKNLLTNKIYAGYYEYKPWGVPLMKGKHEALISWEDFQRIQAKLDAGAHAPARADAADDFPLRGFVTCDCCGHPLTAYWAKGRNKRYAYYECFNKECDERRKSIRRDVLEGEFETLIRQMQPSTELFTTTAFMFRDQWNNRIQRYRDTWHEQKRALGGIGTTISKLTDRLIETTSPSAIKAYESKLEKLEAEKALITENLTKKTDIKQ
ncbi:unnamed protein product, partial [Symbiodinium microadriaticum]